MLFDLQKDPHLLTDLAAHQPELIAHGLKLIESWVDANLPEGATSDPLNNVIVEGGPYHAVADKPAIVARLRRLGRDEDARLLEQDDGSPRSWVRS